MACTPAPACRAALAEATALWPNRSKASDGICPSAAHTAANPNSDHERGEAFDVTNDPGAGCDCNRLSALLVARRDPRVKYIIWNNRIIGPGSKDGWSWSAYTGKNPHTSHMHVSIVPAARNSEAPWWGGDTSSPGFAQALAAAMSGNPVGAARAFGEVASGVADAVPGLSEASALAGFLTDRANWRRVAYVLGAVVLAVVGLALLIADTRAARVTTTAVGKVYSAGSVDLDGAQ